MIYQSTYTNKNTIYVIISKVIEILILLLSLQFYRYKVVYVFILTLIDFSVAPTSGHLRDISGGVLFLFLSISMK